MGHHTKEKEKQKQLDDAPPPYSSSGPPPPLPQQVSAAPPAPTQRLFPTSFSMYRESSWTQRSYMIGEHQATPLYAVTLHSGWSGQPDLVLHNGPNEKCPPLAGLARSVLGTSATITVRPVPGSGLPPAEEKMEYNGGFGPASYMFTIEVGVGGVARRESFEWRHSSGGAVKGLDAKGSGWKLVRLETGPPPGMGQGASFVGGGVKASDGKEVVAVWAWASASLTKNLKFKFIGTGASGVLGERWAIMAVASALRIWDRERRQRNQAAANAAGGGGA
ncbi:hypothetical protein F5Y13DRAFT_150789 [Hypoxylon sp. FL1857]|nr:hypothetical protein F5Y13DRAFT_150789 [Hypoxylon sp. FL1857]